MRLGILFSGGKDSTFTINYFLHQAWEIACLMTLLPSRSDSYMFQQSQERLARCQAAAMTLPILCRETSGDEGVELRDLDGLLEEAKRRYKIDGVAAGALASDYQLVRISHACQRLGLKSYAPLWHKAQAPLLREMISAGFDIRMVKVAAEGLDRSWLGRRLTLADCETLERLHREVGLHPGGEGGEYETVVLGGPLFTREVRCTWDVHMEDARTGDLILRECRL